MDVLITPMSFDPQPLVFQGFRTGSGQEDTRRHGEDTNGTSGQWNVTMFTPSRACRSDGTRRNSLADAGPGLHC